MNRLALVLLFLATAAFGEPATIKVFEAKVYEKPDAASAVVHTFAENAQVSVSETPENGFRKVRLPDGKIGYVEESSLSLGAAMPSDAPLRAPEATASAPTPPKPTIYVKDLYHLATLVKDDKEVAPMARGLADRQTAMMTVGITGLVAGAAISLIGIFVVPQECSYLYGTQFCHMSTTNTVVMSVGLGVMSITPIVGLLFAPSRNDIIDVINKWNTRHPEDQFSLDRASSK